MKTSFVALLTLAAGAFAGPIGSVGALVGRDQTLTVTTLTQTIKTYTLSINTTIEALPVNPTVADKTTAIEALAPQLEGITDTLHTAIKAAATTDFLDVDGDDLIEAVKELVHEIAYTVHAVVVKIGIVDGLVVVLKPLFVVLGGLVSSLDTIVSGLLAQVEGILNSVLRILGGVLPQVISLI